MGVREYTAMQVLNRSPAAAAAAKERKGKERRKADAE